MSSQTTLDWTLGKIETVDSIPIYIEWASVGLWFVFFFVACFAPNFGCIVSLYEFEKKAVLMTFSETLKEEDGKISVLGLKGKLDFRTVNFFFFLTQLVFWLAVIVFWDVFLFDTTYTDFCVPGKACFNIDNATGSTPPINCSVDRCNPTPFCNQSSAELICYELVLDFGKAAGIAGGLFKISGFIVFLAFLCLKKAYQCNYCFYIFVRVGFYGLAIVLLVIVFFVDVVRTKTFENIGSSSQFFTAYFTLFFMGLSPQLVDMDSDTQDAELIVRIQVPNARYGSSDDRKPVTDDISREPVND